MHAEAWPASACSHRKTILWCVTIVLLTVAIRTPLLPIPLDRDEGEYAYIAWRLGFQELPYRDWVDQKPPAVFWIYRLALSLPFESVRSIHLMALFFAAASAIALFFLARRFVNPFWAGFTAVLFAILSADPLIQGTSANTETFMLLPLILSQMALLRVSSDARRRIAWMLLAGILTGLATTFKQVAAMNWFFLIGLYPFLVAREKRLRDALAFAFWSATGATFVWAAWAVYFWRSRALPDFIYHVFTHNFEYIRGLPWSDRLSYLKDSLLTLAPSEAVVWLLAIAGLGALLRQRRRHPLLFLAGWMGTSLMGVSASGYFFPHYFQQFLPALSLSAALGAQALEDAGFWKLISASGRRMLLGLLLVILPARVGFPFWFIYSPGVAVAKIYPDNPFAVMPEVGRRIAEVTRPEDRVFVFGAEPEVLFYARRASATRYIFLFPLFGPYRDALQKQTATAQEVSQAWPAAVFYLPNELFFAPGTEQYFTRWSQSFIRENFRYDRLLVLDGAGTVRVLPAAAYQSAASDVIGALLVRTNAVTAATQ